MLGKTTKADLAEALSSKLSISYKDASQAIDLLWQEIMSAVLSGKTVELRGFGTFELKQRKGRDHARNPKTGETVKVEDHWVVIFRAGRELKRGAWNVMREHSSDSQP